MVAKIKAAVGAGAARTSSSSRAPTRAPCTASTRRSAAASNISRPASTAFSSRRRRPCKELERVGRAFKGVPQIANMLEGGGQTPVLPPQELKAMGFAMAAYPTTLIFRVARTIERALADIKAGKAIAGNDGVNFAEFKDITNYNEWARIEDDLPARRPGGGMRRVIALLALALAVASGSTGATAQTKVRLAVGGQSALYYLPLTVTDRLGYFKDEGLDVEISDLAGGSKALQALIGGSADVVTGAFDHTIQMQAKNQPITAVVAARAVSGIRAGAGRRRRPRPTTARPISRA